MSLSFSIAPIKCLENQFDCGSGVCVPSGLQCDNITDCFQARDEYGCYGQRSCSVEEFTCGDGQCVALNLICDGSSECQDNSDEIGCPSKYFNFTLFLSLWRVIRHMFQKCAWSGSEPFLLDIRT